MAGGDTKQRINDLETENAILREAVKRLSNKPTLRDRFVMAALAGIEYHTSVHPPEIARYAFQLADALMEERNGK